MAPSKTLKKKKGEGRGGPPVRAQASHLPFIIPSGTGRPPFLPEKSIDRWSRWNVVPSRETTHAAASSATQRFFHCRGSPPAGHLPSRLSSSLEDPLESRRGGSSFPSLWISLWNFQLSFKREKEEGADLFHKCIGCDIIREGNESLEEKYIFSNIFAARIETASIPPDTIAGSVDPDREGGSRLVRLVYRYRTISRRFGDSVSYSEQRSLHLPILASAR